MIMSGNGYTHMYRRTYFLIDRETLVGIIVVSKMVTVDVM